MGGLAARAERLKSYLYFRLMGRPVGDAMSRLAQEGIDPRQRPVWVRWRGAKALDSSHELRLAWHTVRFGDWEPGEEILWLVLKR